MSNPIKENLSANPDIKIDSNPTGNPYKANNALWITI